jgi:hypothetical protein
LKNYLLAGLFALSTALAAGGYFGKQYFDEHYVLLNEEEVAQVQVQIMMALQGAYASCKDACKKTI